MKKLITGLLIVCILCGAAVITSAGRADTSGAAARERDTVPEYGTEQNNYPSASDLLKALESGEDVLITEAASEKSLAVGLWNGKNDAYPTFSSLNAYDSYLSYQSLKRQERNYSSGALPVQYDSFVLKADTPDGGHYILASLKNEAFSDFFESADNEDAPSPANDARIFALVEKGYNTIFEKNPAVTEKDAVNGTFTLSEAAEQLKNGKAARVCDLILPDGDVYVSSMLTNGKGYPLTVGASRVFLDNTVKKEYSDSFKKENELTGAMLSLEIVVPYETDGVKNETLIYAYLPVEYLDEAVNLNLNPEKYEKDFLKLYGDKAIVFFIRNYKNSAVLYLNDAKAPHEIDLSDLPGVIYPGKIQK